MNTRYTWKSFRWVKNHEKLIKTLYAMCNYKQSYQLESSQSPPKYTYRIHVHHTQCVLDYRCLESTSLLFNSRNPLKDFVLSRNSPKATLNLVNKDHITHGNLSTLHDSQIVSILQAQSTKHSPITLDMFLDLFRPWERENDAHLNLT